jgi:hypothetical protein
MQGNAVIRPVHEIRGGENMVIDHVEPVGFVLVVGRIDENFSFEEMRRRIGREDVFDDRVVCQEAGGRCHDDCQCGEYFIHFIVLLIGRLSVTFLSKKFYQENLAPKSGRFWASGL